MNDHAFPILQPASVSLSFTMTPEFQQITQLLVQRDRLRAAGVDPGCGILVPADSEWAKFASIYGLPIIAVPGLERPILGMMPEEPPWRQSSSFEAPIT